MPASREAECVALDVADHAVVIDLQKECGRAVVK